MVDEIPHDTQPVHGVEKIELRAGEYYLRAAAESWKTEFGNDTAYQFMVGCADVLRDRVNG